MPPHLLIVAFHFPPIQASSGVHRTLSFARYLTEFGWRVTVLTANERAYENVRIENNRLIPASVEVVRAPAWDTARHFSVFGRYPRFLALPDRWRSWIVGGVAAGRHILKRNRSAAIFSTFPIASSHVIASALHHYSGLPWIADFRDPMTQEDYPKDPVVHRTFRKIESRVFDEAAGICVTTPSAAEYYRSRFPERAERVRVIENGFDPDTFERARVSRGVNESQAAQKLVLLHSGLLYPVDRNPEPFFRALTALRDSGELDVASIEVRLRASGFEDRYRELTRKFGLEEVVTLLPPLPYEQALEELLAADALVLFQGSTVSRQVPAKLYEYLFAGRPILGVTDPDGDSGRILREFGVPAIAKLEDADALQAMLRDALPIIRAKTYPVPARSLVMKYSRQHRARELERWLTELTANGQAIADPSAGGAP